MINHLSDKPDIMVSKATFNITIFSIFLILFSAEIYAQSEDTVEQSDYSAQSNAMMAEKIYLQLDRTLYSAGDVIWFKSIVTNALDHALSQVSGILYVEIVRSDGIVYEKKLLKISNGLGEGYFHLEKDTPEGTYLIRAYTNWNRNFENNFLFEEYIRVLPKVEKSAAAEPVSKITLIKDDQKPSRLQANLNPLSIDSLHAKELDVHITVDGNEELLELEKNKNGTYLLDYEIPEDGRLVTIEMLTSGWQRYSKTIVLDKDYIDLQFFPESGELVNGIGTKVGFKALDVNGRGLKIEGDIVDEHDTNITSFESNNLGMGSFYLPKPFISKKYYGRVKSHSNEDEIIHYPLPEVSSRGNSLSIERVEDDMHVTAFSNYLDNDSISLRVSLRGVLFYDLKVPLKNGMKKFIFSGEKIPEGIVSFSMLDHLMQPVAERLFFHERPGSRMNINILPNKDTFSQRELTELEIETTTKSGNPVNADLSVLVLNKKQLGNMQQMRTNILSYLLLESELRGEIEQPGYYFREDSIHLHQDLDALMLTQGWRKYNYSKSYDLNTYRAESALNISGKVGGIFNEEKGKVVDLILMTTGENLGIYNLTTDSAGSFNFLLDDTYGANIEFLLQTKTKKGQKKNFSISLDQNEPPPINLKQIITTDYQDSTLDYFKRKSIEREKVDAAFSLQSGYFFLEEVEVNYTPARKRVNEKYGPSDEIIDGAELARRVNDLSTGVLKAMMETNMSEIIEIHEGTAYLFPGIDFNFHDFSNETLVLVDGIYVFSDDYHLIQDIPISEVVSIEAIKNAKNYDDLLIQKYSHLRPESYKELIKTTKNVHIVSIYTRAQKGVSGFAGTKGIIESIMPALSEPIEFYEPNYATTEAKESKKPDLRAIVHWEPMVKTGESGKAETSFYNADNPGEMLIVIEAISETGQIGYKEFIYQVEGEEKERIFIEY